LEAVPDIDGDTELVLDNDAAADRDTLGVTL